MVKLFLIVDIFTECQASAVCGIEDIFTDIEFWISPPDNLYSLLERAATFLK
jgi:hypothetical protein